jgi:signal peptidase II
MSPRLAGLLVALVGIAVDQMHKWWMLGPFGMPDRGRITVAPFLDLVMVWNRGVSYGLFTQDSDLGRWALVAVGLLGAALFSWWLFRSDRLLPALSLGLVIAGAVSNAIDRVLYGAVADFFLFRIGSFEWYVFNLADVWIVAGVVGMLLAWATERPEKATEA